MPTRGLKDPGQARYWLVGAGHAALAAGWCALTARQRLTFAVIVIVRLSSEDTLTWQSRSGGHGAVPSPKLIHGGTLSPSLPRLPSQVGDDGSVVGAGFVAARGGLVGD